MLPSYVPYGTSQRNLREFLVFPLTVARVAAVAVQNEGLGHGLAAGVLVLDALEPGTGLDRCSLDAIQGHVPSIEPLLGKTSR
jgi:hypothetical protein